MALLSCSQGEEGIIPLIVVFPGDKFYRFDRKRIYQRGEGGEVTAKIRGKSSLSSRGGGKGIKSLGSSAQDRNGVAVERKAKVGGGKSPVEKKSTSSLRRILHFAGDVVMARGGEANDLMGTDYTKLKRRAGG